VQKLDGEAYLTKHLDPKFGSPYTKRKLFMRNQVRQRHTGIALNWLGTRVT